jgi:hypothetical protein
MVGTDINQRLAVTALAVALGVGCHSPRTSSTGNLGPPDPTEDRTVAAFVVLPAADVASHPGARVLPPTWDPATNVVAEALLRLQAFLSDPRNEPLDARVPRLAGVRRRLPNTVCQVIGVRYEQKKGVFLNCLPADSRMNEGWRERYIRVSDGGPRFWRVVYFPEEGVFFDLQIDHGY